eukprot:116695-Pleurochrysis_carterae.AAC.1
MRGRYPVAQYLVLAAPGATVRVATLAAARDPARCNRHRSMRPARPRGKKRASAPGPIRWYTSHPCLESRVRLCRARRCMCAPCSTHATSCPSPRSTTSLHSLSGSMRAACRRAAAAY